jgi:hypothetical protein
MAQHISLGHCIQLHNTSNLSTKPRYMDYIIREATEIDLHPKNMNRKNGFCLRKSWKTLISSLKDCTKPPSKDSLARFFTGPCKSAHCPYQGTNPAPSGHPSTQSLSFLSSLHLLFLLFLSPTTCLQPMHMISFPLFPVLCPPHTYNFSPPSSHMCQLALLRSKHSLSSPVSYWFTLVL